MTKTPSEPVFKKIIREVVREEFKPIEDRLDSKFEVFKIDLLNAVEKIGERNLAEVAKMRDETVTSNDKVAGEIETMRREQTLLNARSAKINDIEDEVEKLQKIHPQNSHQSLASA